MSVKLQILKIKNGLLKTLTIYFFSILFWFDPTFANANQSFNSNIVLNCQKTPIEIQKCSLYRSGIHLYICDHGNQFENFGFGKETCDLNAQKANQLDLVDFTIRNDTIEGCARAHLELFGYATGLCE